MGTSGDLGLNCVATDGGLGENEGHARHGRLIDSHGAIEHAAEQIVGQHFGGRAETGDTALRPGTRLFDASAGRS